MSLTYPRYLTFLPGELEKKLREIDNTLDDAPGRATALALALTSLHGTAGTAGSGGGGGGRSKLLKIHRCPASFPDGFTGSCTYTRGGPTWHIFQFIYGGEGTELIVPTFLPPIHWTQTMGNDIPGIEAKAKDLAEEAYLKAALREQTEYFARASEGSGRRKHPLQYRMTAGRAKEMGGKYALCVRVGGDSSDALVPICPAHEHLVKANADWLERRDPKTVVACCNRLDRKWQLPRFNPLYAEFDPRPKAEPVKPVYMVISPVATPAELASFYGPDEPDEEEDDEDCGDDYDEDFDDEENFDDADDDDDTDDEEESEAEKKS